MSISDNEDTNGEDFEMVSKPGSSPEGKAPPPHKSTSNETVTTTTAQDIPQESRLPSSTPGEELEGLNLKSPTTEAQDPMQTNAVEPPHYAPPPGPPPPLPPRPRRNSKATLNAGLQFGKLFTQYRYRAEADGSRSTAGLGRGTDQCAFAAGDRIRTARQGGWIQR